MLNKVCLFVALFAFGAHAQTQNLVELATSLGATTLVSLLEQADLKTTIESGGPFTIFAPTNDAFSDLSQETLDALNANKTLLQEVLKYHVINGETMSSALMNEQLVDSLQMTKIRINIYTVMGETVVTATGSVVEDVDKKASNGVIHLISKVMMMPEGTVTDHVSEDPMLSTLLSAVVKAKLDTVLAGAGPFTVFAPSNSAFDKIDPAALQELLNDEMMLTAVLKYHVMSGTTYSAGLSNDMKVDTLEGNKAVITMSGGKVMINNAMVTMADKSVTNGVVHIIDTVLMPPNGTVVDIVKNNEMLSTLLTAVVAAKLDTTLSGMGPFTVFAPNNAAFDKIPKEDLDALLADEEALAKVLKYHVVPATAYSGSLMDGQMLTSLEGMKLTVKISGGKVMINGATVVMADMTATNGVAHVIDTVIMEDDSSSAIVWKAPTLLILAIAFLTKLL